MTKEQILQEVATSEWQPEFEFTDDLDTVVDSILKPREDYFLGLHSKVKEIIEREAKQLEKYQNIISFIDEKHLSNPEDKYHFGGGLIIEGKQSAIEHINKNKLDKKFTVEEILYSNSLTILLEGCQITFVDVCNWQRELFEYKKSKIEETFTEKVFYAGRASRLPNQNINLGLRQSNVKVGEWTPPAPMFLEGLKEMCFPIDLSNFGNVVKYREPKMIDLESKTELKNREVKICLTDWYKIFETIFYFEDFNYVLGQIVINIMSYVLTGKYLIRK